MKTNLSEKKKKERVETKKAAEIAEQREFIQTQREYKKMVLARLYKGAEIIEIRKQLETGDIKMQWYGMPFPKHILTMEHDIIQHQYMELLRNENEMKKRLERDGMKEKQIDELVSKNKYMKEVNKK